MESSKLTNQKNNYFDLKAFLNEVVFDEFNLNNEFVLGESLRVIAPLLKHTIEFENVEVELINMEEYAKCETYKVTDGDLVPYKKIKLYSIGLSPKMYSANSKISGPDELSISPLIYNPETFAPYKIIQISFSPLGDTNIDTLRKELYNKVDILLDAKNKDKYEWPSERSIIIRGILEK